MKSFSIPSIAADFYQTNAQPASTDTYALYQLATQHSSLHTSHSRAVLDLGCGSAILLLMLAKDHPTLHYTGIEIQPHIAQIAQKNLSTLATYLNKPINYKIINTDYASWEAPTAPNPQPPNPKPDLIISNPPYYPKNSGKPSPSQEKNIARFETTATQYDLLKTIKNHLAPTGTALVSYPASRRLELEKNCHALSLSIKNTYTISSGDAHIATPPPASSTQDTMYCVPTGDRGIAATGVTKSKLIFEITHSSEPSTCKDAACYDSSHTLHSDAHPHSL